LAFQRWRPDGQNTCAHVYGPWRMFPLQFLTLSFQSAPRSSGHRYQSGETSFPPNGHPIKRVYNPDR